MRELLNRHCTLSETPDSWAKEAFLTERLCVPPEWIHEAKAMRARVEGDKHKEALYLFKSGHWNQCHKLVIRHLASGNILGLGFKRNEGNGDFKGEAHFIAPTRRICRKIMGGKGGHSGQSWATLHCVPLAQVQVSSTKSSQSSLPRRATDSWLSVPNGFTVLKFAKEHQQMLVGKKPCWGEEGLGRLTRARKLGLHLPSSSQNWERDC